MTPPIPEHKAAIELAKAIVGGLSFRWDRNANQDVSIARALLERNAEVEAIGIDRNKWRSAANARPQFSDAEVPACAAIKAWGTILVTGKRHNDCFSHLHAIECEGIDRRRDAEVQGFMTTRGRFVDRKEAMALMIAAGRTSANKQAHHGGWSLPDGELDSSDLY